MCFSCGNKIGVRIERKADVYFIIVLLEPLFEGRMVCTFW